MWLYFEIVWITRKSKYRGDSCGGNSWNKEWRKI